MSPKDLKQRLFQITIPKSSDSIEPGLYHWMRDEEGSPIRIHLRVETDGHGMLLVNASAGARLSPSGVVIAYSLLNDVPVENISTRVKDKFTGASSDQINRDIESVKNLIIHLSLPTYEFPIVNFDDPALTPYESELIAPLHADVTLTEPDILLPLFDRIWQAKIPHVTVILPVELDFDTNHLLLGIERAEDLGMIAGVRARASQLKDHWLVEELAVAGIDHANILVASAEQSDHEKIAGSGDYAVVWRLFDNLRSLEVAGIAQLPLVESTLPHIEATIRKLVEIGIRDISFFAIAAPDEMPLSDRGEALAANAMPQIASLVEELSTNYDVRFIWQPPVARNKKLTVYEQILRGPRTSDDLSVRITSHGDVIPSRGPNLAAGNLFKDDWNTIWNNAVFVRYRERVKRPTRCDDCPDLTICAVDCPRKSIGWANNGDGDS